jgi:hypothetical protein
MDMLKAAVRACLRVIKWLLIVVLVLVGALFAINAVDESLKPEAAAALRWPDPAVKDGDNGYFALVGLSAPSGQDAADWGRRWVEAMNRASSGDEIKAAEKSLAAAPFKLVGAATPLCDFRADQPCAPQAVKNAGAIAQLTADNAELLGRYAALGRFPQVADTYRPQSISHPIIGVMPYGYAQRLLLSQRLAELDKEGGAPALASIAADIDLQRKVLAGAGSLILKMAANAALARDYQALAEVLRRHSELAAAEAATLQRILAPLNSQELALTPALMAEFRGMAAVLDDPAIADPATYQLVQTLGAAAPAITAPAPPILKAAVLDAVLAPLLKGTVAVLLQKNATRNFQFEVIGAYAALDSLPASGYAEAERALRARQDEGPNWTWLYNPIGKLLMSIALPDFSNYKRRLFDTEGLRRLVVLQAQIAAQRIADADIPAFLAKSEPSLADPYTAKAMGWDAAQRALVFTPAKNSRWFIVGKDGRIAVPL